MRKNGDKATILKISVSRVDHVVKNSAKCEKMMEERRDMGYVSVE